jgi:hypothetical protein
VDETEEEVEEEDEDEEDKEAEEKEGEETELAVPAGMVNVLVTDDGDVNVDNVDTADEGVRLSGVLTAVTLAIMEDPLPPEEVVVIIVGGIGSGSD